MGNNRDRQVITAALSHRTASQKANLCEFGVPFMVKPFLHEQRTGGKMKLHLMNYNSGYAYAKDFRDSG
jgi:hypothetical protein